MKSIDNKKKLTALPIAIFLTAALIAATPVIMSPTVYTDHPGERLAPTETIVPQSTSPQSTSPQSTSPMGIMGETVTNALHWSCAAKAVNDSPEGNSVGWNPNGTDVQFTISEPCYQEGDSIVLVNIKDGGANFEVCNVDYGVNEFFEVYCDAPPSEGSQLRYMVLVEDLDVIGTPNIPMEELPADLAARQNSTQ